MDEATIGRIVGIVKNMQASGMGQEEIANNLKSMGVSEDDLGTIYEKAGLAPPAPLPAPKPEEPAPAGEEHFERLHATIGELHEKHEETRASLGEIAELRSEIEGIKAELNEMKPLLAALKRINENLLEINKKMLAKLP